MSLDFLDPPEHQKLFYRHHRTGDLGWLVEVDGSPFIQLDRPGGDQHRKPFRDSEWVPVQESSPYSRAQLVQIAFEADRHLCRLLGRHDLYKREWRGLTREQKKAWMTQGPTKHPVRKALYQSIMGVLGALSDAR